MQEQSLAQSQRDDPTFPNPSLVLICSWTEAEIDTVKYYATTHKRLFPDTPVMVVTTRTSHLIFSDHAGKKAQLAQAIQTLRQYDCGEKTASTASPNKYETAGILVHALSKGGSYKVCELARAYRLAYGKSPPFSMLCLDSGPGKARYLQDCRTLPKTFTKSRLLQYLYIIPATIVLGILWAWYHCRHDFANNPFSKSYTDLLSEHCLPFGARLCYLYSAKDEIVSCKDVKAHAALAAENFAVTEGEFDSDHVKHAKVHRHDYWNYLNQAWTGLKKQIDLGGEDKADRLPLHPQGHGIFTSFPISTHYDGDSRSPTPVISAALVGENPGSNMARP